uniref:Putative ribonuclease H-like domain-containing protein n=1 Tax=Tanacetum cinerariifolium TaxID=118510 RepID=A0A6L2MQB5_TANCI|nr:putative ribonuclease H-like domain-containing protein [Tanacetum cinerariifolium]
MDSLSPQVVSAVKLPILNPNEFDLWKIRIEQYFLMTDYSLWEVILNGDSPLPTRIVEGVVQPVAPTTSKLKLARKNDLKGHGTLLMALPDKHQLKFNSHKNAKKLMEAMEKRFRRNTETKKVQKTFLKQQYENFTSSSSKSLDQIHDRLQKLIDVDDLEKMDLRWQMAMLTMRARRFLQKKGKTLGANGPTSMGFDMSKVECYNCHRKGHFARECRSLKDSRKNGSYDWSYQADEEPTNFALMAFSASSSSSDTEVFTRAMFDYDDYFSSESDCENWLPSSLYDRFQPSGGYHVVPPSTTGTFMPPKPNLVFHTAPIAVETDHSAFTIQLSSTKPAQDLYHTNRPTAPIIEYWVSDSKDESETKAPQIVPSFVQSSKQVKTHRHSVQPVEKSIPAATPTPASPKSNSSGKKRNRKACFVCKIVDHLIKDCDYYAKKMAQPTPRNSTHRGNHKQYASLTHLKPHKHMVPAVVLPQSKLVSITAVRPVSAVVPKINVTRPRYAHPIVTKSKSPIKWNITRSQSLKTSNSPPRVTAVQAPVVSAAQGMQGKRGNPQYALKGKGVIDSGCSRHMTGNMSYLSDFEELNGGYVAFGGNPKGGKISGKGKTKTGKLDFEDVYFVKELKFNLFSVSQMCDKKNSVLFTDIECLVLSSDFKLPDGSQVLLRVPRENNMYNVNVKNIVPSGDLTCLFAKATINESNLWHRRLAHINFKTINKLVKGNLIRGLPTKVFENDHTCVACKKGKQHRASCKTKPVSSVDQPLYRLHMDLFRPTFVKSLNKKSYCLVNTDDYSRFNWDEGNLVYQEPFSKMALLRGKIGPLLRLLELCWQIHFYPFHFGLRTPSIGFMRPFGCPVTILNTLDSLGKFEGKVDEGFLVGYSINSNAFRVFNSRTRIVQETLHVNILENKPNIACSGPTCAEKVGEEINQQYMLFLVWSFGYTNHQNNDGDAAFDGKEHDFDVKKPECEVILSPSCSAQSRKQDDKTKKEAKGKKLEDITYSDDENDVGRASLVQDAKVWVLVDLPHGKRAIGTKWVFRNKKDERGIVPLGFEDPDHLDKVYKVVKALYGLHQASRACPDQTVSGKDSSNPLMADNLPKIVWYSTHHVILDEELASPKANGSVGKGFSGVETPLFKEMLVGQEIEEEGDADEHVEDDTAGDDARRDDTAAHGEVPTVTQEQSIPSPTPTIPPSQPP